MNLTVHAPSALFGAGILALAFLAGSASQQATKIENLVTDPPTRHAGWSVELLLWRGSTDPLTGEILVEISEPEYYREPELPGGDAGPLLPSLTAQEVESLVGSWPSAPGRSRP